MRSSALIFLLSLLFYSCNSKKQDKIAEVSNLIGREVEINDLNIDLSSNKILILVGDTADCTTCAMQIYDWYIYKLDLDKHDLDCDVIYILNDSIRLDSNVKMLMKRYNLHYKRGLSSFMRRNQILNNNSFTTYLIDKNNRIQLVGSPIENEHLWKLYKKVLDLK